MMRKMSVTLTLILLGAWAGITAAGLESQSPGSKQPAAPASPQAAPPPYTLRVAGQSSAAASSDEVSKKQECPAGSPDGRWKLLMSPTPGEDGNDWTTIEISDPKGADRKKVDRVYRLSGPCWAPDGSYFVYGEGGVVKISAPGRSPFILYQDSRSPRGGIFPAQARNFRWGTAMGSLTFVMVDDPRKEFPDASLVTLVVKRQ